MPNTEKSDSKSFDNVLKNQKDEEERVLKCSQKFLQKLKLNNDDTDEQSRILAKVCMELDKEYGVGTTLALDWFLDHYIGYEIDEHILPMYQKIWLHLLEHSHTYRNKFEYFNDNHAFYVPHGTKQICVFGKYYPDTPCYLVINDTVDLLSAYNWHTFYVRLIWNNTRRNCIGTVDQPTLSFYRERKFDLTFNNDKGVIYGDCRDPGHVLTCEYRFQKHGKCDHVIWDLRSPLNFFFEVDNLWSSLND